MTPSLAGIDRKLDRAVTRINNLERQIDAFNELKPYSVRVQEDRDNGKPVGRLVAIKNHSIPPPDTGLVLLAAEALYHLRSALDQFMHQLVLLHDPAFQIEKSRQHQFPIFDRPDGDHGYEARAGRMIDGISPTVAALIEGEQPYKRQPANPHDDPLWMLQTLNNTDKHRMIPMSVIGIGHVSGSQAGGALFTLSSKDIVLEDQQVFWSFLTPNGRYDDVSAELTCAVAFAEAMTLYGITYSMDAVLFSIVSRVNGIIDSFRSMFEM